MNTKDQNKDNAKTFTICASVGSNAVAGIPIFIIDARSTMEAGIWMTVGLCYNEIT